MTNVFNDSIDLNVARRAVTQLEADLKDAEKARDEVGRVVEKIKAKIVYLERFIQLEQKVSR